MYMYTMYTYTHTIYTYTHSLFDKQTNLNPSHSFVASLFLCCNPLVGEFEVFLREAPRD